MTNANVTENQYKVTVSEGVTTVVTAKAPGPQGADAVLQAGDRGDFTVSVAGNGAQTAVINSGAINNDKVASDAAIAGTKISPDFGSQNIATLGNIVCGDGTQGRLTIKGNQSFLLFTDNNDNDDFEIRVDGGIFRIQDQQNDLVSLQINTDGHVDIPVNLDVGAGLDVTGVITGTSHLDLPSDVNIQLGNSDEFKIFHQSSNNNSIIREQGGGDLSIQTNGANITLRDTDNQVNMAQFITGGACTFRHGADTRLATSSTGIDVTGDISVSGTVDSVDLSTYQADGGSYLRADADDSFTGTLTANSDGVNPIIKVQGIGPNFIRFASTALGIVDADSIDLVYRATPNTLGFERASDAQVMFSVDADTQQAIFNGNVDCNAGLDVTSGDLTVATGHLTVTEGDLDVTEGDLTVSGGALYVDYAGDRVGMGTLSPQGNLHIKSQGDCILVLQADSINQVGYEHNNPFIKFIQDGLEQKSVVGMNPYNATDETDSLVLANSTIGSSGGIVFKTGTAAPYTNAVTRMKIESDGSVFLHNGLTVKDASGSDPTLHLQHSDYDVLGEVFRIGDNIPTSVRYHSIKAQNSQTDSNNLISFHLHDGGGFPRTGQHEVLKLQGNKQVTIAGNLDVGEGIDVTGDATSTTGFAAGTTSLGTAVRFHAFSNNTHIGHQIIIEQDGAGDAVLGWALTGTRAWSAGIDNSDSNKWKLSSGASVDTNTQITIEQDGFVGLHYDSASTPKLSTTASGVEINGQLQINTTNIAGLFVRDNSASNNSPYIEVLGKRSDANNHQAFSGNIYLAGQRTDAKVHNNKKLGSISFGGNHTNNTQANIAYAASIAGVASDDFDAADDMPTDLVFLTGSTGVQPTVGAANLSNAGTERMRITATGQVNTLTAIDFAADTLATYTPSQTGNGSDTATDVAISLRRGHRIVSQHDGFFRTLLTQQTNHDIHIGQNNTGIVRHIDLLPGNAGSVRMFYNGGTNSTPKLSTSANGVNINGNLDIDGGTLVLDTGPNSPNTDYGLQEAIRIDDGGNTSDRALNIYEYRQGGGRFFTLNYNLAAGSSGTAYTYTQGLYGTSSMIRFDGPIKFFVDAEVNENSQDVITPTKRFEINTTGADVNGQIVSKSTTGTSSTGLQIDNSNEIFTQYFEGGGANATFVMSYNQSGGTDIRFKHDGEITLNHAGQEKLKTTQTGVAVTGKATMTESAAIADTNLRKITTSTSAPTSSDGGVGDIWIVYPS